ncbi:hypothetical protein [Aquimarina intermedia]|uniref:Parallel beta helix pectate lyase-like protein n=1 Tax=Aquimarina intermedia TaxID=350814 RepID=A0A5S5CCA5_9FLAO|nr:hypothetical protein [Aquimarina intermedia]TYP75966.1 hypothetical protein BD809_102179 [Aquimarina intermedia]
MKRFRFIIVLFLIQSSLSYAQDFNINDDKWARGWTNFEPNATNYPDAEERIPNIIVENTFLRSDIVYKLSGDVYVSNGATLTIQEGTIIRCDHKNIGNLIISKGSKLIAEGSKVNPIVFTSDKAAKSRTRGDWGGIVIIGSGKVNTVSGNGIIKGNYNPQFSMYGGKAYDEQTSIMKYVRIEFAGNKTKRTEGANGLSLYAVGKKSIINNIMISHSGQDSYSFNGGTLKTQNLISYKAKDDDFEISEGFKGTLNQLIAIRHPFITCAIGSYALEINGYHKELGYVNAEDITDVTITNATLVNLSDKSNYKHTTSAISARNTARVYIHNSKISGFSDVVRFDRSYTALAMIEKSFMMDNSFFNIHGDGVRASRKISENVVNILKYNKFTKEFIAANELFQDPDNKVIPKFHLKKSLNNYMVMQ